MEFFRKFIYFGTLTCPKALWACNGKNNGHIASLHWLNYTFRSHFCLLGRSKMVHNVLMIYEIGIEPCFLCFFSFIFQFFCTKAPRGCTMCLCAQNCLAVRRKKGTVPACSTEFSLLLKDAKLLNFNCGFTTTSFLQHLLAG